MVRGPIVSDAALADDGWLHTGDLGSFDERGRLVITGRKADTIVTGGENVAPAEVEAALISHPAIADVAVHARPDPEWGEAVIATVVLRDGHRPTRPSFSAHSPIVWLGSRSLRPSSSRSPCRVRIPASCCAAN